MAQEMFTTLWKEKLTLSDQNKWTYCKIWLFCLPTVRSQSFPSVDDVLKHFASSYVLYGARIPHIVQIEKVELSLSSLSSFGRCMSSGSPQDHLYHTNPTKIPWRSHLDRWLGTLDSQAAKFTIEEIERGLVNQASSCGLNLLQQGLRFSFGENIKRFSFSHNSPWEIRRKKKLVKSNSRNPRRSCNPASQQAKCNIQVFIMFYFKKMFFLLCLRFFTNVFLALATWGFVCMSLLLRLCRIYMAHNCISRYTSGWH